MQRGNAEKTKKLLTILSSIDIIVNSFNYPLSDEYLNVLTAMFLQMLSKLLLFSRRHRKRMD